MTICLEFIDYAGKSDLPGAVEAVSGDYKCLSESEYEQNGLSDTHVEIIFRVLPKNHELRALVARVAMHADLIKGHLLGQVEDVDGLQQES
jgi:hypothetical protein